MHIHDILKIVRDKNGSDVHTAVGSPPIVRLQGELRAVGRNPLTVQDAEELCKQILTESQFKELIEVGEYDCAYEAEGLGRFRVNAFMQKGTCSLAMRAISDVIPSMEDLKLPNIFLELSKKKRGLILITGPTGSGKSTTLASMLDFINNNYGEHIITIEDPIEYLHNHKKSIINQREVGEDTDSFANALRASLREDPDIILVGEMRDLETIQAAITAAETGHLVLSTLHTIGAAKTIDRIIDVFPPHQQQQIRTQLSSVLEAVISQQLVPTTDGKRMAVHEVMVANDAIRNLIREAKTPQMQSVIQTSANLGMQTMDNCIVDTYKTGKISRETALKYAVDIVATASEIDGN